MRPAKFVLLLCLAATCGCSGPNAAFTPKVQHAGPFTIVNSNFDYHETLAYPDGREFEFRHEGFQGSLTEEGSVVEIDFTGDLLSERFDNHVVTVKVLKHSQNYIKHHPELWPSRQGHWANNSYVLDDGSRSICGSVDDNRWMGGGWSAYANGASAREGIYEKFSDRSAAIHAVEKACR